MVLSYFEIRHIPGTTNTAADALSRNLSLSSIDPTPTTLSKHQLRLRLRLSLQPVMGPELTNNEPAPQNIETDDWLPAYELTSYCKDDIRNHVPLSDTPWHHGRFWRDDKIVVPEDSSIRNAVISAHHSGILQGHWGESKTTKIVRRRYWFPNMSECIHEFIRRCDTCQRITADRHKKGFTIALVPS